MVLLIAIAAACSTTVFFARDALFFDLVFIVYMRVGPHPHAWRLDSLRSLAAAAGALQCAWGPTFV